MTRPPRTSKSGPTSAIYGRFLKQALLVACGVAVIAVGVWRLSFLFLESWGDQKAQAVSSIAAALAQFLSAFAVVGTLGIGLIQFVKSERRRRQERYDQAISKLRSDNLTVRLDGITWLKSLVKREPYYWSRLDELLVDFLRSRAKEDGCMRGLFLHLKGRKTISEDMTEVIRLLGARQFRHYLDASQTIDLSGLRLVDIKLQGTPSEKLNFSGVNCAGSTFIRPLLFDVDLSNANLSGVKIIDGNISGVNFEGSRAYDAVFSGTQFHHVKWTGMKICGSMWRRTNVDPDSLVDVDRRPPH